MEENGVTTPLPLARGELAALAGVIPHKFDELFECVNVLDRWPGKQGKGSAFPLPEARARAIIMVEKLKERKVILLGRRVEMAFGLNLPWLTLTPWIFIDRLGEPVTCEVATCPHPSGVNRWWNDASNRRAAATFWGSLVPQEVK